MNDDNKYIRFDWAAKRMLRDKANFGILEGLLTVLCKCDTYIIFLYLRKISHPLYYSQ